MGPLGRTGRQGHPTKCECCSTEVSGKAPRETNKRHTGSLIVILENSGQGIQIGTFWNWNDNFGKMRPEPEISDREGHFGGGEGCEKSGEMTENVGWR